MRDVNNKTGQPTNEPKGGDLTRRLAKASEKPVEGTVTGSGIPKNRTESPPDSRSREANSANRPFEAFFTAFERHFTTAMSENMGISNEFPVHRAESLSNSLERETLVKNSKEICSALDNNIAQFKGVYTRMTGRPFLRPQSDSLSKPQDRDTKIAKDKFREANEIPERTGATGDTPLTEFFRRYIEYKEQKAREGRTDNTSDKSREVDERIPEGTGASGDTPIAGLLEIYKKYRAREGRKDSTSDQSRETDGIPEGTGATGDTPLTGLLEGYGEFKDQEVRKGQADSTSKAQTGDGHESDNTSK